MYKLQTIIYITGEVRGGRGWRAAGRSTKTKRGVAMALALAGGSLLTRCSPVPHVRHDKTAIDDALFSSQ